MRGFQFLHLLHLLPYSSPIPRFANFQLPQQSPIPVPLDSIDFSHVRTMLQHHVYDLILQYTYFKCLKHSNTFINLVFVRSIPYETKVCFQFGDCCYRNACFTQEHKINIELTLLHADFIRCAIFNICGANWCTAPLYSPERPFLSLRSEIGNPPWVEKTRPFDLVLG